MASKLNTNTTLVDECIALANSLPKVNNILSETTVNDNGKILMVADGVPVWSTTVTELQNRITELQNKITALENLLNNNEFIITNNS